MPLFGKKKQEPAVFDPRPHETAEMPARPYRVLHANLPFYADPKCQIPVQGAYLVVLLCEDPAQTFHPVECMPSRRQYQQGQIVKWEINKDRMWAESWYVNPETGRPDRVWAQSVEFDGIVVKTG